jgi:hypothetical protein
MSQRSQKIISLMSYPLPNEFCDTIETPDSGPALSCGGSGEEGVHFTGSQPPL